MTVSVVWQKVRELGLCNALFSSFDKASRTRSAELEFSSILIALAVNQVEIGRLHALSSPVFDVLAYLVARRPSKSWQLPLCAVPPLKCRTLNFGTRAMQWFSAP